MAHHQQSNLDIDNYLKYLVSEIVKVNSKVDSYANWLLQYTKKDETLLELINSFPKFVVIPPPEEGENGALAGTIFDEDQVGAEVADLEDDDCGSSYFEVDYPGADCDIKPLFPVECLDNIDEISISLDVKQTKVEAEEDPQNLGPNNLNQSEQEETPNEVEIGDSPQTDPTAELLALMKPCSVILPKLNMLKDDDIQSGTNRHSQGSNSNTSNRKRNSTKARIHKKKYKCTTCNKQFVKKVDLNRHFRIHTGEKPFQCNVCKIRFTGKSALNMHFLIHTGEKPFRCIVCQNTFRQKSALDRHFLIHTGEKPFRCETCGERFRQRGSLIYHQKRNCT